MSRATSSEIKVNVDTVNDANTLTGVGSVSIYTCTQAEYDAIITPNTSTFYVITDAVV